MIRLHPLTDDDFATLLAGEVVDGLTQPEGGVEAAPVLAWLRQVSAAARAAGYPGTWLIGAGGMAVGLCGFKAAPEAGAAEIGYGLAPAFHGRGIASEAVAALVRESQALGLRELSAVTEAGSVASQRVLEKCGFASPDRHVWSRRL